MIETSLVISGDSSGAEAAARRGKAALDQLGLAGRDVSSEFKSAASSAEVFNRAIEENARGVRSLQSALDPAIASARRMEAAEQTLAQAVRLGNVSVAEQDRLLGLLRAEQAQVAASTGRFAQAQTGVGGILSRNRFAAQQFGFQLQDVAVQLQGGTAASIVFAQQGSQILGIFGAMGAILGAVLAVALPIGAALFSSLRDPADAADDAVTSFESLREAVNAYANAAQNALIPTAELERKYGEATGAARVFLQTLLEISQVDARQALTGQVDEIIGRFVDLDFALLANVNGGVVDLIDRYSELSAAIDSAFDPAALQRFANEQTEITGQIEVISLLTTQLSELSAVGGVTEEQVIGVANALATLDAAEGPQQQAEASQQLLAALEAALGTYDAMKPAARELFTEIAATGQKAAEFVGQADEAVQRFEVVAGLSVDLKDTLGSTDMSGVIGQAAQLAARLGIAVDLARGLNAALNNDAGIANPEPQGLTFGLGGVQDTTVGSEQLRFGEPQDGFRRVVSNFLPEEETNSRSGRGAAAALRRQQRERQRLIDEVSRDVRGLRSVYEDDVAAIEAWRDQALAALEPTAEGYARFADDVELIYRDRLRDAYLEDLQNNSDWASGIRRGLEEVQDNLITWADVAETAVVDVSAGLEDAFADFATTGKASIDDLVDHTLRQLARLAFQQSIQPAVSGLFDFASGAIGGIFGSSVTTSHTGSIVGSGVSRTFTQGLSSDERPGILKLGQRVFTPSQIENGAAVVDALALAASRPNNAASMTVVEINNYSNAEVRETRRPDGGVTIDIMGQIERDMAGRVSSGRGPLATALKQGGLSPAGRNGAR